MAETVRTAEPTEPVSVREHRGRRRRALAELLRDPTAMVGLVVLSALLAIAVLGPELVPHDPTEVDPVRRFAPPSAEHPLGTDHVGRDLLARVVHGARLSLGSTAAAALAAGVLGVTLGMAAGYLGGVVDTVISRVVDMVLAFPSLLLALVVVGALGPGLRNVLIAVVLFWWAGYARIVRGVTLAEREKPYVEAARAVGSSRWRIARRHLLPNIIAPIVVLTTLEMGSMMLAIAALSFLGFGVEPAVPEWGAMLSEAQDYLRRSPTMMAYPGVAIFVSVLAFNLLGDGLRDVLDPRLRRR
jgi:peptide/nickel transport system permease protein